MSRTAKYKAFYFAFVLGGSAIGAWAVLHFHIGLVGYLCLVLILLLPGRILAFYWRDLLRGLRFLRAKNFAESKRHSLRFLDQVRPKPWLKKLIWLATGTYSRDPEALALNNLGAAEMKLGEIDAARGHLEEAIAVDPLNPLPFFNLGILFDAIGEPAEAARCAEQAKQLGFRRDLSDRIVMLSQQRFAATDGLGKSTEA